MWNFGNLSVGHGEKVKGYLQFPLIEEKLPVFLINGEEEGPAVLILGGIHGCEYTSIDAALEIGKTLLPKEVKGKIAVIPIANPRSFYTRSIYVHPEDNKNLNRSFPGKEDGTAAEKLAYCLNETAIKEADYIIDLHGGDMIEALVPFTIYHVSEDAEITENSRRLASLFGIEYVVGSTGQVGGSTYSSAALQGKVAIIAEAGQQGILDKENSQLLQDGVKNALRSIGSLDGVVKQTPAKLLSTFDWSFADYTGLWYPNVAIGQSVAKGELLGEITDEFGESIKKYYAGTKGVVLFLVTSLAINLKDPLLAIGD
ncbi:M14 family metallopeptidase [Neobacillus novalis]|uniref:M14 family metallopeptidase n=1 Tax=Neobacillus novalis TaxID=220687 RepID=A0AA95SJ94_9BACI|nr:M14 family metallopeptidase [Neobacillus novalis]WHY88511.1 M14 family metallopeptidase [Neobacillus novalis]